MKSSSTRRVLHRLLAFVVLLSFALETGQSYQNPAHGKAPSSFREKRDGHEILPYQTIPNNPEPAVKTKRAVGDITNLHSKLANLPEPAFRSKRAANHLATIHSRLTMAARIFSGISMRLGIHDDSLTGDQLIAEMLNLDSINLDNVANFNKTKVDNFFESLKGLTVPSTKELEKKIVMMNAMRKRFERISNPDDKTSLDAYISKIENFPDVNAVFKAFKAIVGTITSASVTLDIINKGNAASGTQNIYTVLKDYLNEFANLSAEVGETLKTLKTHENLIDRKILESPMVQNVNLIKLYGLYGNHNQVNMLSTSLTSAFDTFLTTISNIPDDSNEIPTFLNVMQKLGTFQSSRRSPSGFINGFPDVSKLSIDVQDTWISNSIGKYDKSLLKSELEPLDQFQTSYQAMEEQWKQVSSSDALPIIQAVGTTLNKLETNLTIISEINGKAKPMPTIDFATDIITLVDHVLKFRETLITLKANLTRISKMNELIQLKSLVLFKDKIDFSSQSLKQVQDAMPKKGSLGTLIQSLNNLKSVFANVEDLLTNSNLENLPGVINSKKGAPDVFKNDADKIKFFGYCNYLKQMKPHLVSLSASVTLIRAVRKIQNDQSFIQSLKEITQKISGSIQDFNTLRTIPGAIKTTQTPRMDEFIQLKPIEAPSKSFGEAVAVLDTAHTIISSKADILNLIEKGWSVNDTINNSAKQDEEKSRLREDWRQFGEVAMYFESLITKLEASMTSARRIRRAANNIQNYATQLESFKNLPDFQINLQPMMSVLESLITVPDHTAMLTTMKTIAKWDLQFSSHATALSTAGSSVANIMGTFGSIQKPAGTSNTPSDPRSQPVVPGAPNGNDLNVSPEILEAAGQQVEKEKEDEDSGGLKLGLAIGFGLLFLVAMTIFVLIHFKKEEKVVENPSKKSKKRKKNKTVSPLPRPARHPFDPSPDDKKPEDKKPVPAPPPEPEQITKTSENSR